MDSFDIKAKLKLLIAYHVGEVLDVIHASLDRDNDRFNEVLMLMARYRDLNRDAQLERLSYEQVKLEMNQIRLAIMEFIDAAGPQELRLEEIKNALIKEGRFQKIMEMETTVRNFIGMFGHQQVKFQYLRFKWEVFFERPHESRAGFPAVLWDAVALLQQKFKLAVMGADERTADQLLSAVHQLRTLSQVDGLEWEYTLDTEPTDRQTAIAYIHETIEALLEASFAS